MSEQEGAARRRRVANPWVIALHAGGVALIAVGLVLHAQFWQSAMLGLYGGFGSEFGGGDQAEFLRTVSTGQLVLSLVPVMVGAGFAAVLGGLALQAVAWEQRMRIRAAA